MGTDQAEDKLIYERPDNKELGFGGSVTDDGHYLVIQVWQGTSPKNRLYYKDLTKPDSEVVKLLDDFDAQYQFVDNDGQVFWIQTDLDAPRGRLIAIDTQHPERANWKTVVPQSADKLEGSNVVDNLFLLSYLKDARTEVRVHDLKGKFRARTWICRGSGRPRASAENEKIRKRSIRSPASSRRQRFTATIRRRERARCSGSRKWISTLRSMRPSRCSTRARTGRRVPMFLTYKKGLKLDGQNPTLLYAYGGFDISLTPSFSVPTIVWLEMGGIYAQPNLRGGGEYGEDWHLAGTKAKEAERV